MSHVPGLSSMAEVPSGTQGLRSQQLLPLSAVVAAGPPQRQMPPRVTCEVPQDGGDRLDTAEGTLAPK